MGVLRQGRGERPLLWSDRRQAFSPARADTPLPQRGHTNVRGVCVCLRVTPSAPPPLTFRSMSRTHLCTRWLVQTTGSMFCVSQRARRSWRAWCGEDSGSAGFGGGTTHRSQGVSVHCGGDPGVQYREKFWPASPSFSGHVRLGLGLSSWEMGRSLLPGRRAE